MIPDYNLCDVCKAKVPKDCRFFVAYAREMDGAGDSVEAGEHVDLCNKCLVLAVQKLLKVDTNCRASDYDKGKKFLSMIKSRSF